MVKLAGSGSESVEQLNGTNWSNWKFRMEHFFKANELWEIVSGSEQIPSPEKVEEVVRWKKADVKALSKIVLAVDNANTDYIRFCETSSEAWKELEKVYDLRNTSE